MKLYLNETSPFSRVVAATALLSRCDALQLVWVDPWQSPAELEQVNPFCIIPVLALNDGVSLSESLCICQYLIATYQPDALVAADSQNALETSVMGLAKTMMETAFRTVALGRFVEGDNELSRRGKTGLVKALQKLEAEAGGARKDVLLQPNLATLYLHVALEYVQFRHSEIYHDAAGDNIMHFLEHSPFKQVLQTVSLERLATKPDFQALMSAVV
ncbi:glutathione S-transferase family protein [Photobacterium salinisoli]|uniref:glutathione S-transferase family protein n=1 Tax=Photobacterium salinisoli TaxID=1616783 RepID=UPI000EA086C4|nr:glutathione S-transferase family protein [Photobacterium salinisoli]